MMSQFVSYLLTLPPAVLLIAALLFPAIEASALIGVIIPGETAVFVAGLVSSGGRLPLWAVMVVATLGAVSGDQVGFLLGRRWGPAMLDRLPRRLQESGRVDKAIEFVQRRGAWAVLLGRWTALLRALVPGIAGTAGIRRRSFTLANLVGGTTWAVTVAALGYGAGAAYQQVVTTMDRAGQIAIGLLLVVSTIVVLVRRARRHLKDRRTDPSPAS